MKNNKKSSDSLPMLCDNLDFVLHEEYRLLRTNVKFSLPEESKYHCIGVTSSIQGESKTTTAINLSYTLAENGEKVCLVEADMRLPSVGKKMYIVPHVGLSEYLTGQASVNDVLQKLTFKKCSIHCIQAGTLPPNPAELLASSRMEKLFKALGEVFTYIVIDLPPVTLVSDTIILGKKLDGIIMVISQSVCTKRLLREAMKQISLSNIKVLGFVRTFCTDQVFGYLKNGKRKYKYKKGYQYRLDYNKENK